MLTAGTKLGTYQVVAQIGAGGMGEVYRARDTRLQRVVALKVLPEVFAADASRMARFDRKARCPRRGEARDRHHHSRAQLAGGVTEVMRGRGDLSLVREGVG
jgi:serine/threonine protein kinase